MTLYRNDTLIFQVYLQNEDTVVNPLNFELFDLGKCLRMVRDQKIMCETSFLFTVFELITICQSLTQITWNILKF
jgi:hypothetical protein